ncbi:MAG: FAD-binding oxidoreductase [Solirubrobacteraceae bacterium]|nr:FAD-binding oxidoreductase [Solirubrobacteraceae bacterium]
MSVIDRLADLRARVRGTVTTPNDPGWDTARQAWNLAVDQRPAVVVEAAGADDVEATVLAAREAGLRVAVQGTGHGASARGGDLEDAILLRTSSMRTVTIDPERRVARVQAGAMWGDVMAAAAPHGLTALHGSAPDVGVVGYTLGGGIGWFARKHGLASGQVTAAEVVLPDGRRTEITERSCPQLFWALRGGGGSFGVVTELEFSLLAIEEVHAGALLWPQERAAEILRAWRDLADTFPDEVTSIGRLLNFPPAPQVPEPLRGRKMVVVEAASLLGQAETDALLAPLRALGPELDTFTASAPEALLHLHNDPPGPVPAFGGGVVISELPDAAIDTVDELCGAASGAPIIGIEFRHLGGALGRAPEGAGAMATLPGRFAVYTVGPLPVPEARPALEQQIGATLDALAPWTSGSTYLNFAETPVDATAAFPTTTVRRLRDIAAAIDPDGVLHPNHSVRAY